jgi:hypothetical protein
MGGDWRRRVAALRFFRFANWIVSVTHYEYSVRRVTLFAQLIDCAGIGALLDFVSAHGEPVLCRYAPNPR